MGQPSFNPRADSDMPLTAVDLQALQGADSGGYQEFDLCSTTTTIPGGGRPSHPGQLGNRADQGHGQVQEALQQLTSNVEEALHGLRTELPALQRETAQQRKQLEGLQEALQKSDSGRKSDNLRLSELLKQQEASHKGDLERSMEMQAILVDRVAGLERNLQDTTQRTEDLEQSLGEERSRTDDLQSQLADEQQQRCELDRQWQQLNEAVRAEMGRVHELAMREMRERMDSHKVLREEVQIQQQSLLRLTSRVDEVLMELRTELPRLTQEGCTQKMELERVQEQQASGAARLDALERELVELEEARADAEAAVKQVLRADLERRASKLAQQISDVQGGLEELRARSEGLQGDAREAQQSIEDLTREGQASREGLQGLSSQLKASEADWQERAKGLQQRCTDLDVQLGTVVEARLNESEARLHGWVDSAVTERLNTLERALRKEMSDRSSGVQQAFDKAAHNATRWSQLQAKFDELLLEANRASPLADFRASPQESPRPLATFGSLTGSREGTSPLPSKYKNANAADTWAGPLSRTSVGGDDVDSTLSTSIGSRRQDGIKQ